MKHFFGCHLLLFSGDSVWGECWISICGLPFALSTQQWSFSKGYNGEWGSSSSLGITQPNWDLEKVGWINIVNNKLDFLSSFHSLCHWDTLLYSCKLFEAATLKGEYTCSVSYCSHTWHVYNQIRSHKYLTSLFAERRASHNTILVLWKFDYYLKCICIVFTQSFSIHCFFLFY